MNTIYDVQVMIEAILKDVKQHPNSTATKRLLKSLECGTVAELQIKLQDADTVLLAAKTQASDSSKYKGIVEELIDYLHLRDFNKGTNRVVRQRLALFCLFLSLGCFVTGNGEEQSLAFGLGVGMLTPEWIEKFRKEL